MKFAKQLIALAIAGASLSAFAESDINTGTTAGLPAVAKLDFRISVPRIIFLSVGTGTAFADVTTVDRVDFNLATTDVGSGAAVAGALGTGLGYPVPVRVLGNGGNVSLTANGIAGGLTNGAQTVPWTQITGTSSSAALPNPAIGNGVAGAAASLPATAGVVNQSATWSFSYTNSAAVAAGQYTGRVTYTAALP
jgi:hypothetical protein